MDKVALLYFTKFSLIGKLKLIVCALPMHGEASSQRNSGASFQCRSKANITGGGTPAPEARAGRGVWGHARFENFEIQRLGNAISSVLQELFVIYAYRELFTSYIVSANQCTLRV